MGLVAPPTLLHLCSLGALLSLPPTCQCFSVRSLGWVEVPEEDLVPGKSSIAVNNCIQQLAQTRSCSQPPDGAWGEVSWWALQVQGPADIVVPELPFPHGSHLHLSSGMTSLAGPEHADDPEEGRHESGESSGPQSDPLSASGAHPHMGCGQLQGPVRILTSPQVRVAPPSTLQAVIPTDADPLYLNPWTQIL